MPSSAQLVAKNSLVLILSNIVTKVLSFIFVIAAARYLGTIHYGQYAFLFALASFFLTLNAFGLETVAVREVAQQRQRAGSVVFHLGLIRMVLGLVSLACLMLISVLLDKPSAVKWGLVVIGGALTVDGLTSSLKSVMAGYEALGLNAILDVAYRFVVVTAGVVVMVLDLGFLPLVGCSLVASILTLALGVMLYMNNIGRVTWAFDQRQLLDLVRSALPFAVMGVLVTLYFRVDVVMLSMMRGDREVGWYSAGYSVSETCLLFSSAINTAVFPAFSRMAQETSTAMRNAYVLAFKTLMVVGLPMAVCTMLSSRKIILLLFGPAFEQAAPALQVLVWAAIVMFFNSLMGFVLYAIRQERFVVGVTVAKLLFNVTANLLVIPRYGYLGAAATTLLTELLGFCLAFYGVSKKFLNLNLLDVCIPPALAATLMGGVVYFLRMSPLVVQGLAGVPCYLVLLLVIGVYTDTEKKYVKEFLIPFAR